MRKAGQANVLPWPETAVTHSVTPENQTNMKFSYSGEEPLGFPELLCPDWKIL